MYRLSCFICILWAALAAGMVHGQSSVRALRMPKELLQFEKRISLSTNLSQGELSNEPWVVFGDRGEDFGKKYYVTEEINSQLKIYEAQSCDASRRLSGAREAGLREKSKMLVYFGAAFTEETALIHKKCVILNNQKVASRINMGEISNTDIPYYNSPESQHPINNVPLYAIFFVYKEEQGRLLIGKNYFFKSDNFHQQIIGWVDKERVVEYNTRICFEPNYQERAVASRKCDPRLKAQAFEFPETLSRYMQSETAENIWEEKDYYYYINPIWKNDRTKPKELFRDNSSITDTIRERLCTLRSNPQKLSQAKILTNQPLPGTMFRFPLIKSDPKNDNFYKVGVAGTVETSVSSVDCEAAKNMLKNVNVYFFRDYSLGSDPLLLAMQLIRQDQSYRSFTINYGLCIYPRSSVKHTINVGERGDAENNYKNIMEFNETYVLPESHNPADNYLEVLNSRLKQEKFDPNKVNIIVLFGKEAAKSDVFNENLSSTAELLAKNRCHLLAINVKNDIKFAEQIRILSLRANQEFHKLSGGSGTPGTFETNEGITYLYDYLLSFIVSVKDLRSEAVGEGWKFSSKKLLTTIQNLQNEICGAPQSSEGIQIQRNDNFTKTYGLKGNKRVTFLMEGWIANKYDATQQEFTWAPEVLFNETELDRMVNIMNKYYDNNKSANELADALYETYLELFNSFVGEKVSEKEIRDLTPSGIMSKIVGGTFGLDLTNDFKKLTLGEIRSNSESTQRIIKAYENTFKQSVARLSSVRQDTKLRFTLDSERSSTGVYYYWVPMSYLP